MPTLREIQNRLRSVQNIAKITKSMKMIASTKMTRAQRAMEVARAYGASANSFFTHAETVATPSADDKATIIAVSSDRGLCGSIHSSVAKAVRRNYEEAKGNANLMLIGDKSKAPVGRFGRKSIHSSYNQVAKDTPTFYEASLLAGDMIASGASLNNASIVFNKFLSVIAFDTLSVPAFSVDAIKASPRIHDYEVDSDEVLENFAQFQFANQLFWALSEGYASEMAAKRTAMENATKNAEEMITKLTLTYNRSRQASITNDLVDIITGASAL